MDFDPWVCCIHVCMSCMCEKMLRCVSNIHQQKINDAYQTLRQIIKLVDRES